MTDADAPEGDEYSFEVDHAFDREIYGLDNLDLVEPNDYDDEASDATKEPDDAMTLINYNIDKSKLKVIDRVSIEVVGQKKGGAGAERGQMTAWGGSGAFAQKMPQTIKLNKVIFKHMQPIKFMAKEMLSNEALERAYSKLKYGQYYPTYYPTAMFTDQNIFPPQTAGYSGYLYPYPMRTGTVTSTITSNTYIPPDGTIRKRKHT